MEIQIFTESLIKKAKLSGRYSTADSYLSTLHRLQLFTNAPDMHFDKITPELIKAFEHPGGARLGLQLNLEVKNGSNKGK